MERHSHYGECRRVGGGGGGGVCLCITMCFIFFVVEASQMMVQQ